MNRSSVLLLLTLGSLALSCGSGPGRQLQSITISQTANGQQIQFVATGHFSQAPTTVSPLPVSWGFGLFAPPPKVWTYTLTSQPFVVDCTVVGPQSLPVSTFAPVDPNAPISGSTTNVVTAAIAVNCP
jgi:hypothetical protein